MPQPQILFLKVETNGLPNHRLSKVTDNNIDDWPHIICIRAYVGRYNNSTQQVSVQQYNEFVMKHADIDYNMEACNIHKFTPDICEQKGIAPRRILEHFNKLLMDPDIGYIVGHNINFNYNVLISEMVRQNVPIKPLLDIPHVDIMTYNHQLNTKSLSYIYQQFYGKTFPQEKSLIAIILCFAKLQSISKPLKIL